MLESGSLAPGTSVPRGLLARRSVGRLAAAVLGVCMISAPAAMAGFTTVNPNPSDETSQGDILSHVYGGTFTASGVNYSNGTLTAVRVSDFLPSTSSSANPGPNPTDQLWQDNAAFASAQAVWAEEPQGFGFIPGASGGTYQQLFHVNGTDYNVTGSGSLPNPAGMTYRWAETNPFGIASSLPSDNTDGKDHMVTYQIDGLNDNFTTWMLFFDDYGDDGKDADFDFQDLVVELKTIPATSSVPEPGTLMLSAGAGLLLLRRRRAQLA